MHVFWLVWLAICVIYYFYRFYKNVRRYPPGPFPLPLIGNLHQFDLSNMSRSLDCFGQTYGAVFTVYIPGPTIIVSKLPELRQAFVKQGEIFAGRPQSAFMDVFMSADNCGIVGSQGLGWKMQRRLALRTLRDFGVGSRLMETKVLKAIDLMFDHIDRSLADSSDRFIDVFWPIELCVGNVINHLLLGRYWKFDDCDQFINFKENLDHVVLCVRTRVSSLLVDSHPWMKQMPYVGWYGFWQLKKEFETITQFMRREIAEREKSIDYDRSPTDFVSAYLHEIKSSERAGGDCDWAVDNEQLVTILTDFWTAGLETTATTLSWAMVLMVAHRDVQSKVQQEIDRQIGKDRSPSMADKMHMPYTSAVIMELQRKVNLVTINLPHRTLGPADINGMSIPEGANVIPQIAGVLYDRDVFPQPEQFRPLRFLLDDGVTFNKIAVDHLIPFGLGKRQCAGESLARMEHFLILTALLQRYSLDADSLPDTTPMPDGGILNKPRPCLIRLTNRSNIAA